MSTTIEPSDFGKLLKGVEINVYQAKGYVGNPGTWHAHVSTESGWGTRRNYFEGCILPPTKRALRWAAENDKPEPNPQKVRALRNGGDGYFWADIGHCDTEDEARERACVVVGYIFGQRLAEKVGPQVIPAKHIPAERKVAFA